MPVSATLEASMWGVVWTIVGVIVTLGGFALYGWWLNLMDETRIELDEERRIRERRIRAEVRRRKS